jgi:hypothetical protein
VYCVEACDQASTAAGMTVTIDSGSELQSVWRGDLLGGATVILGSGHAHSNTEWDRLYRRLDDLSRDRQTIAVTAIPYFLWANRARGSMNVWIPTEAE